MDAYSNENYKTDDTAPDEIKALVAEIVSEIEAIDTAREELAKMRAKRVCPKCGELVTEKSAFCNYCGEKLIYTEE